MTLWEQVDERVLRWVFGRRPTFDDFEIVDFDTRDPKPFEPLPGLDTHIVAESLARLRGYGLIDGKDSGWMGGEGWSELRVTARGLVYLGEWPDLDLVASAASFHRLLRLAAEDAPEDDRAALLKAAGVVGRTVDGVIRDTLSEVAHAGGEDVST